MSAPAENGQYVDNGEDFSDSADEWDLPAHTSEPDENTNAMSNNVPEHLGGLEKELRGDSVPVTFRLPSGETIESTFYMGQTVEYLKIFLEQNKPGELAYNKTALYLGDKQLLDPLSLNDLPFKAGENNEVKVVTA